jgi:hypothetical protein
MQVMLQTTICDGLTFDPFALEEDGLGPPEVNVSRSRRQSLGKTEAHCAGNTDFCRSPTADLAICSLER